MNHCIKCESQVDYQKYCDSCVELYGLQDKQDTEFWRTIGIPTMQVGLTTPMQQLKDQLELIFRDDMTGKTSNIAGTIRKFKKDKRVGRPKQPLQSKRSIRAVVSIWQASKE